MSRFGLLLNPFDKPINFLVAFVASSSVGSPNIFDVIAYPGTKYIPALNREDKFLIFPETSASFSSPYVPGLAKTIASSISTWATSAMILLTSCTGSITNFSKSCPSTNTATPDTMVRKVVISIYVRITPQSPARGTSVRRRRRVFNCLVMHLERCPTLSTLLPDVEKGRCLIYLPIHKTPSVTGNNSNTISLTSRGANC